MCSSVLQRHFENLPGKFTPTCKEKQKTTPDLKKSTPKLFITIIVIVVIAVIIIIISSSIVIIPIIVIILNDPTRVFAKLISMRCHIYEM